MQRPRPMIFMVILMTLAASGCATLQNRGSQALIAESADKANGIKIEVVTADGAYHGVLPSTIVGRSSWSGITVNVIDPCYVKSTYEVPSSITRSFWANLFFIYGFLIDPFTGYMWDYDDRITVPAKKKPGCT